MAATDTTALTEGVRRAMPLTGTLGVEMVTSSAEQVSARLAWSPSLCTTGDIMHGGAIMALADSTGGLCAFNNLPEGASGTSTIESKTNFLRAVRSDYVEAVSKPLHVGRTVIVIETDVRRPDGALVARVTQSQAVLHSS
jgi:1,4-dihydroxy-2-naphthoyl-CoA hydrolase